MPIPADLRRRSAIHEIGHVVVGCEVKAGEFLGVSIVDGVEAGGSVNQEGGGARFEEPVLQERTRDEYLARICTALGGLAAEEVLLGTRSAGGGGPRGSDLYTATTIALMMEASYGLGEGLAHLAIDEEPDLRTALSLNGDLRRRVERMLGAQFQRAREIVENNRNMVLRLAELLDRKGVLSAAHVLKADGRNPDSGVGNKCLAARL